MLSLKFQVFFTLASNGNILLYPLKKVYGIKVDDFFEDYKTFYYDHEMKRDEELSIIRQTSEMSFDCLLHNPFYDRNVLKRELCRRCDSISSKD